MSGKSQEIATIDPTGSIALQLVEAVRAGKKVKLAETYDPAAGLDRVATASAEDLFAEDVVAPLKASELIGKAVHLTGAEFRNSDYEEEGTLGIYAVLFVTYQGRPEVVTCGATQVVTATARALELNALPRWVTFTEDKTKAGYKVVKMVGVKAPAVDQSGVEF